MQIEEIRSRGKSTTTMAGAAEVDPNKPLTDKQKQFVRFWASGETIANASHKAGYGDGASYAYRMSCMPNIRALYDAEKRAYEEASQMTRKTVMDGLLEGIELAKMAGEPSSVITGWKTIGQMCGYFEPVRRKIDITVNGSVTLDRMNRLGDAELLRIIHDESANELQLLEASGDDAP